MKKSKRQASEGKSKGIYPFFTSSNIQDKWIDEFDFDGEYLIFGTGGNPSINWYNGKFSTSTDCFVIKCNETIIKPLYLYVYFKLNMNLLEDAFKGQGLKHLSTSRLNAIELSVTTTEHQNEICEKCKIVIDDNKKLLNDVRNLITEKEKIIVLNFK